MVFLWRNSIEWIEKDDAALWLDEHPDGLLIVPQDVLNNLDNIEQLERVSGLRYAKGGSVSLCLVERSPE